MKTLIIGMGEVGSALNKVLRGRHEVYTRDIEDIPIPSKVEIVHICIRYSEKWAGIVRSYATKYKPDFVNICTTVPPGSTEALDLEGMGIAAVHSTTRGLHPNLSDGLKKITKHIGGTRAEMVARYFNWAGVTCVTHKRAITTELAHLLSNINYGINLMFADEMARICRHYGVDYYEAVMRYNQTGNEGFSALDMDSKCRMILTPPGGHIGGHCVVQAAEMIEEALPNFPGIPQTDLLAWYNKTLVIAMGKVHKELEQQQNENHPLRKERDQRAIFQHTGNGHSGAETGSQDMREGTKR